MLQVQQQGPMLQMLALIQLFFHLQIQLPGLQ